MMHGQQQIKIQKTAKVVARVQKFELTRTEETMIFLTQPTKIITISDLLVKSDTNF
jgi:hypothetical protein